MSRRLMRLLVIIALVGLLPQLVFSQSSPPAPVQRNADWTPVIERIGNFDMALVPPGCFLMGFDNNSPEERPSHEQCIQTAFYIDVTEVTNAAYGNSGASNIANAPRESVTWSEAFAFCEARGGRLPTEAEWEYAARGPDSLLFTWGNDFQRDAFVWPANAGNRPSEVASTPQGVSWVGAHDMIGNVWEWTSSLLRAYPYNASDGREDLSASGRRVTRGGAFNYSQIPYASLRGQSHSFEPSQARSNIGFRCAIDLEGERDDVQAVSALFGNQSSTTTSVPTTTPAPIQLTIVNESSDWICYVYFGFDYIRLLTGTEYDQLGKRERIGTGQQRSWEVLSGTYIIELYDCQERLLGRFNSVDLSGRSATVNYTGS
jgi:hypothetical protein